MKNDISLMRLLCRLEFRLEIFVADINKCEFTNIW